jgi:hypothetical protein
MNKPSPRTVVVRNPLPVKPSLVDNFLDRHVARLRVIEREAEALRQ